MVRARTRRASHAAEEKRAARANGLPPVARILPPARRVGAPAWQLGPAAARGGLGVARRDPQLTRRPAGADTNDEARFYLGVEKAVLFNTHEDGLTEAEAVRRLEKFGKNQLPEKEDNKLMKLAMEFIQPMPLMIWAAIFIEVRAPARDARQRRGDLRQAAAAARGRRGARAAR